MKLINVYVPERLLERLDELVERGRFASRGEAIRFAICLLLEREGRW